MSQKPAAPVSVLSSAAVSRCKLKIEEATRLGHLPARRFARPLIFAGFALSSFSASAFLEDLCFQSNGTAFNCQPAISNALCTPGSYLNADACSANLATEMQASNTNAPTQQRSTVHMDATFYLAEFVGYSPTQAYWIAAYDQAVDNGAAVDNGIYIPRGSNGVLSTDVTKQTKSIDGLGRNSPVGGAFFHYEAPYSGIYPGVVSGTNGLTPNTSSAYLEPTIYNIENWAKGTPLLCVDGLTTLSANGDYSTGSQCYNVPNADGTAPQISAEVSELDNPSQTQGASQYNIGALGPQIIATASNITYATFDNYIGNVNGANLTAATPQMAKFGIYMHSYQDRISHHRCLDVSSTNGPQVLPVYTTAGNPPTSYPEGVFNGTMTDAACQQTYHILRHSWETGVTQSPNLQSADRTTAAALNGTLLQLQALAPLAGVTVTGVSQGASVSTSGFVQNLYSALQQPLAPNRINAIVQAATQAGLTLMPGF